jgi:hypothetical protein
MEKGGRRKIREEINEFMCNQREKENEESKDPKCGK